MKQRILKRKQINAELNKIFDYRLTVVVAAMGYGKTSGLHLVIIFRTKPTLNLAELRLKGYCYLLPNDLFELSRREIKAYFRMFGQTISDEIAGRV